MAYYQNATQSKYMDWGPKIMHTWHVISCIEISTVVLIMHKIMETTPGGFTLPSQIVNKQSVDSEQYFRCEYLFLLPSKLRISEFSRRIVYFKYACRE